MRVCVSSTNTILFWKKCSLKTNETKSLITTIIHTSFDRTPAKHGIFMQQIKTNIFFFSVFLNLKTQIFVSHAPFFAFFTHNKILRTHLFFFVPGAALNYLFMNFFLLGQVLSLLFYDARRSVTKSCRQLNFLNEGF